VHSTVAPDRVRTADLVQPDGVAARGEDGQGLAQDRIPGRGQQLRQAAVGVEDQALRRERRRPVPHVLDEHPVRAVGGGQREHLPVRPATDDDEGVDLAGADGPEGVFSVFQAGERIGEREGCLASLGGRPGDGWGHV
jgi:hypothetical protein